MRMLKTVAVTASVLLVITALPANADIIENGGFENPALDDRTWRLYDSILGWSLVGGIGHVEIQNNVAGTPYEGEQFVELDSTRPSAIYQSVAVEAGQAYTLRFAFAARPGTDRERDNVMTVTWGGLEVSTW